MPLREIHLLGESIRDFWLLRRRDEVERRGMGVRESNRSEMHRDGHDCPLAWLECMWWRRGSVARILPGRQQARSMWQL